MLKQVYSLKNEENLPDGLSFVDPYDSYVFTTSSTESLNQFIKKINTRRAEISAPILEQSELRELVITYFSHTLPPAQLSRHFETRSVMPSMSNIISLATAIVTEIKATNVVDLKTRSTRARDFCMKCTFHSNKGGFGGFAQGVVRKLTRAVGLDDSYTYPEEEYLGKCNACGGCVLADKVRFSNESLLASTAPYMIGKMLGAYGHLAFERCHILNEALEDPRTKADLMNKLRQVPNGVSLLKRYESIQISKQRRDERE